MRSIRNMTGNMTGKIMCAIVLALFTLSGARGAFAAEPKTSGAKNDERSVSLNMIDTDLASFIKLIGSLTEKNFILPPNIKGKTISVISHSKISVDEAYKVFESVLEVHGLTIVEAGEVLKIVTLPEARGQNVETLLKKISRDPEDKVVTQLVTLKYADPEEVRKLFSQLVSKGALIQAYAPTNSLILTDIYSNIGRLLKILDHIDVPDVGEEISIIPLSNGDAVKLVRILTTMFQETKRVAGKITKSAKFVADERTNSIVTLADREETKRIQQLIRMLDKEIPRGKEKIRVYYLENATAEELAKVLQSLSTKQRPAAAAGKKEAPVVSEAVNITADKATNSLIIMAEKEDFVVLEEIIKKLDIPRAMVYIECLIMEVNVDDGFTLGAEWIAMGKTSHDGTKGAYGGGFSGGGSNGYSNIGGLMSPMGASLPDGYSVGVFSELLDIGGIKFPNLAAIAQAFQKSEHVNILSTPQVLTTDNEEATIYVGRNVPYLTKSGSSTVEAYNTYEYKDVGITLKITPQISKDRLIRLKISQEVQKLAGASSVEENRPTTLKRTIDTTVIVNDKNTIAIGGLIDDSFSRSENRVPCLGDIPVAGWLFKTLSKSWEKTNLFIFLTPHVVENPAEASALYEKKKEYMDEIKSDGVKLYDDTEDEAPKTERLYEGPVREGAIIRESEETGEKILETAP